jgi:hypothetical protein
VQACVNLPYVLALGTFSFNFTLKSVDCFDCRLYTCVNNSLSTNWSSQALFILRARKDVWLPVNLRREWQHSPLEGLITKVVSKLLTQSKRHLEWIILVMVGLTAIAIKAAMAGVVLQTSIQTHEFVAQ